MDVSAEIADLEGHPLLDPETGRKMATRGICKARCFRTNRLGAFLTTKRAGS